MLDYVIVLSKVPVFNRAILYLNVLPWNGRNSAGVIRKKNSDTVPSITFSIQVHTLNHHLSTLCFYVPCLTLQFLMVPVLDNSFDITLIIFFCYCRTKHQKREQGSRIKENYGCDTRSFVFALAFIFGYVLRTR